MFKRREPMMPDMNMPPYGQGGFYQDNQSQRIFYQLEETNRKLRNLNNRLKQQNIDIEKINNILIEKYDIKYSTIVAFDRTMYGDLLTSLAFVSLHAFNACNSPTSVRTLPFISQTTSKPSFPT